MDNSTFTVTHDHLRLLPHLVFEGLGKSFGVAENSYGSEDVYGDMGRILDIEPADEYSSGERWFSDLQIEYFDKLHAGMKTVLQIMVVNNGVSPEEYEAPAGTTAWTPKFVAF